MWLVALRNKKQTAFSRWFQSKETPPLPYILLYTRISPHQPLLHPSANFFTTPYYPPCFNSHNKGTVNVFYVQYYAKTEFTKSWRSLSEIHESAFSFYILWAHSTERQLLPPIYDFDTPAYKQSNHETPLMRSTATVTRTKRSQCSQRTLLLFTVLEPVQYLRQCFCLASLQPMWVTGYFSGN